MSLDEALDALKRKDYAAARAAVARAPQSPLTITHFLIRGLAEMAMEDWGAAMETFIIATEAFPKHAVFWLNRGIAEENQGLLDLAIISQEKCLALNPAQGEACGNLSNLYRKKKRLAEAEAMGRRAVELGASKGDALNSLGIALDRQGKFAAADAVFREAEREAPENASIKVNRANLAVDQLRFNEAWPLFAAGRTIEDKPIFRHDEALARLLDRDYARGWELYEARLEMPGALRMQPACPRWNGEDLRGKKLLVLAEQGFGDVIQFCRYAAFVPDADLIWAVPKPLVRLLSANLRGTVLCETDPLPVCDYYVPIMSLPVATGQMKPEAAGNYMAAPQTPTLPPGKHELKIGLVWAGSRTHLRDHERSIKLAQLAPVLQDIAADFYAPFTGDALEEIGDAPVMRLNHLIKDFADAAALLKQMDYLVTVDTASAHLAGALGVKTFLLLAHCPDWRWGVEGETTEWYPSVKLLRQPAYGDWESVIVRLIGLLKKMGLPPSRE